MKKILVVLIGVLLLNACGKTSKKGVEDWFGLDNEEYSISYPPEWKLKNIGDTDKNSFMITSVFENSEDKFVENVSMSTDVIPENINFDKYMEMQIEDIKKTFPNNLLKFEKLKSETINETYYKLIYNAMIDNIQFKFEQLCMKKDKKVYIITFCTVADSFDKDIIVGEKILNSFQLN